ncbi:MAG: Gfo/Idh/MocA family oxidoreductase, partial [Planctomycetes bacterium]|nr:Gfo/Idh/MocA family oxidoreductase [Planctomycetota bacterium]
MPYDKRPWNRRRFLNCAGLGAGLGMVAPAFVPSHVLGAADQRSANERVTAALIGCGGRGMGLLPIHNDPGCTIAAVCDVDQDRAAAAGQRVGGCDVYTDFRQVLDRQDIDAVLIATPDHWHAAITIMACESGKDVYCEKPLCRTIDEGRKMVQAARRYDRVVQMGTQYRSIARTRQACEWVRNGRFGKIHTVRLSHPNNRTHPLEPARRPPPNLDWNLWLGPAPWADYHPARCHFTFRWFFDYGGGSIADNGVHMFSVVSWAMGTDETGPVTVEASGRREAGNLFDTPVEMTVRYTFADPPFEMIWEQPGSGKLELEFIGTQATLGGFWEFSVTEGTADLDPTRGDEVHLDRSDNHAAN